MVTLIQKPVRRLFAFGCSFTNYQSTTWPEILAEHLDVPYFNFGKGGTGNLFTFNQIMMADSYYKFTEDDLIIVCWTNSYRLDSFQQGQWQSQGTSYFESERNFYQLEYHGLRDLTFIDLVANFLAGKKCQWHFLSMCDFDTSYIEKLDVKYQEIVDLIQPSFYNVLWQGDLAVKTEMNRMRYGSRLIEFHPSPLEHFHYLTAIFGTIFSKELKLKVHDMEKNYYNFWMEHLNNSSEAEVGFHTMPQSRHEELKNLTTIRRPENYSYWLPHNA